MLSACTLGKTSDSDRVEVKSRRTGENALNMKQGLQLRLSQQLAMTPQLQQAIRLLQLSTLELQQELQQALDSNPLLEQTDLHDEVDAQQTQDTETLDSVDALEQKEMPDELPLDASWDEIYTAGTPSGTRADYQDDELPVYQGETYPIASGLPDVAGGADAFLRYRSRHCHLDCRCR